ncbi:lytic murein transglycosylase [Mesorhizobium sp. WSM3876]|nr:lytic murein transglycosylase [Mesorhizobium sp. WSM3876]
MLAFCRAPLCPAGHLPHKGGDQPSSRPSPIFKVARKARSQKLPISRQVGEMSGRTEGGAKERSL